MATNPLPPYRRAPINYSEEEALFRPHEHVSVDPVLEHPPFDPYNPLPRSDRLDWCVRIGAAVLAAAAILIALWRR